MYVSVHVWLLCVLHEATRRTLRKAAATAARTLAAATTVLAPTPSAAATVQAPTTKAKANLRWPLAVAKVATPAATADQVPVTWTQATLLEHERRIQQLEWHRWR